jgi:hypothetical protein
LRQLKSNELENIRGGGALFKIAMGFLTAGSFIVGLVDGYLRPLKCRNK